MIRILEDNSLDPALNSYVNCFSESIKCHHNSLANYFEYNYIDESSSINSKIIFHSLNFNYIPNDLNNNEIFYYLCRYDYTELLNLYLKPKLECLNSTNIDFETEIRQPACNDNTEYIYILLLKSVKHSICDEFASCKSLTQISLPPNIPNIGTSAFEQCSFLKKIYILPSVKSIDNCSFSGCSSLFSLCIPSSVTSIGDCAFNECTSLKKIYLPISLNVHL